MEFKLTPRMKFKKTAPDLWIFGWSVWIFGAWHATPGEARPEEGIISRKESLFQT
jgi:hypothetical protein